MNYVISDLHGYFDKYTEMLKTIRLKDSDSLFLLGNVCDRGPAPFAILQDALLRCNVFPIIGKTDYRALRMLTRMNSEKAKTDPSYRAAFAKWISEGGMTTVTEFRSLDEETQADVLEFIRDEFVAYDEIEAGDNTYVMVHGGIPNPESGKSLDAYSIKELINAEPDFSREYFGNKLLVTGKTPTFEINEHYRGRIYRRNGQIGINCGVADGESLACLCLDTGEEFYV